MLTTSHPHLMSQLASERVERLRAEAAGARLAAQAAPRPRSRRVRRSVEWVDATSPAAATCGH
jgi:hypothetical protein